MSSPLAQDLAVVFDGFDASFNNDLEKARELFSSEERTAFKILGLGVTLFLQAALGIEEEYMQQAITALEEAETKARAQIKAAKSVKSETRFPAGTEWEVVQADALLLRGLTQALGESYTGYLSCLYSMNSAHKLFTKVYNSVFPDGLSTYSTPAGSPIPSRQGSSTDLRAPILKPQRSLLARFGGSSSSLTTPPKPEQPLDGPLEETIAAGAAFGYGIFSLVLSLLPSKIRGLVGFFGFKSERSTALQALSMASTMGRNPHAVFSSVSMSSLVLMTYHGIVLLLLGWQADEAHIIRQYLAIVDELEARYPKGSLWILNRAKILRYTYKPDEAIAVLQEALKPERATSFVQADALLVFELAWIQLSQRKYREAAETFMRMTQVNNWSHATYYFLAAGCYISIGDSNQAQKLLDDIPDLLKKKVGGKDLPTEVLIRKKLASWKAKQVRRGGDPAKFAEAIKLSPAEELGIIWNTHAKLPKGTAITFHIQELLALTPHITTQTPFAPSELPAKQPTAPLDLDTPDEQASRSLLLGILHRTAGEYAISRTFLQEAVARKSEVVEDTWIIPTAVFELATLDLREVDAGPSPKHGDDDQPHPDAKKQWASALNVALGRLDNVTSLVVNTDLSSRLESRVAMLRDEIGYKKAALGL